MELREILRSANNAPMANKIGCLVLGFYLMFFFYWGREEGLREIPTKVLTPILAIFALLLGSGKYIFKNESIKWYLFFLLFSVLSYFWVTYTTPYVRQIQMMAGIVSISLVLYHFIIKYNAAAFAFLIISIGSFFLLRKGFELTSVTIVSALGDLNADNTLKSFEENENSLACLYLIGIGSIYVFDSIVNNRIIYFLSYIGIFALLYGISLTASRSTLMAGIILIVANFTTTKSIKNWLKILIIIVFIGFVLTIFENILFSTGAGEKLLSTGDTTSDKVRELMILEAWNMFVNNPILGVGLGNVVALSTYNLFSHNDFLEVAATLGIIGIAIYITFLYKYYKNIKKLKSINPTLYLAFLNNFLIYIFMGFFSVWFTDAFLFILLFMQVAESDRLILANEKQNSYSLN